MKQEEECTWDHIMRAGEKKGIKYEYILLYTCMNLSRLKKNLKLVFIYSFQQKQCRMGVFTNQNKCNLNRENK